MTVPTNVHWKKEMILSLNDRDKRSDGWRGGSQGGGSVSDGLNKKRKRRRTESVLCGLVVGVLVLVVLFMVVGWCCWCWWGVFCWGGWVGGCVGDLVVVCVGEGGGVVGWEWWWVWGWVWVLL